MFRRVLSRYLVPVLTVGGASALSFFIVRTIGPGPWIGYAYLFAIMGAAWRGGYGPGLIACVMSFCLTPFLFNPTFNFAKVDLNRLVLTALISLLVSRVASAQKRTQEILRRSNEELEARVRERTEKLELSNAELERYAYAASHDLQEPLRMVALYVQLLARRYNGKLDATAHDYIRFISAGSQRMFNVVRDLLSYSRVSSDPEEFISRVSSEEIIAESIEQCRASIDDAGACVTHDPLPQLRGNRVQLIEVFQNLISNAVAYSRPGIPPRIHITASHTDGYWEFAVSDNGIGIDMQYADMIFQPFKRLHGGNLPGTGLGLAICKRVVERHGGQISVHSIPGEGATFRFTLPGARQVSAVHSFPR